MKRLRNIVGWILLVLTVGFLLFEGLVQANGNTNTNTNTNGPSLDTPRIRKRGWHESQI